MVKFYFALVVKAISEIQKRGIVHRDLKPENIMVDENHLLKLVDFGTSRDMFNPHIKGSGNGAQGKRVYDHFVGTPNFMAPEKIHNKDSNFLSDIFAMGIMAYQFVTGFPAYIGKSEYLIFTNVLEKPIIYFDGFFSELLKDLIENMTKKELKERLNLDKVMNHDYFADIDWGNIGSYED